MAFRQSKYIENFDDVTRLLRNLPAEELLEPQPTDHAPALAVRHMSLPDYVKHDMGVDEIGRLSAEAVISQYESAAKSIEAMGAELIDCAKRAEKMAADVKLAIEFVKETADKYREEAKSIFDRIEKASLLTIEVRETCDNMRRKIEPGD